MNNAEDLEHALHRIDGRSYKAYKDLRGYYAFANHDLAIDHVQGDPFAAPSKMRLRVATQDTDVSPELHSNAIRTFALRDFLARQFRQALRAAPPTRSGSGKGGSIRIDAGGQAVLDRSATRITSDFFEFRIEVGLPAAGRRVLGRAAGTLLCDELPRILDRALAFDSAEAFAFVECIENQEHLRSQLRERELVAFVGEGALLARESGASERPLTQGAIPFQSPDALRVELPLAHPIEGPDGECIRHVSGMAVRQGVTLIVGGGYHGKSTLLRAIERAVYPHIPGDGREWVIADPALVKIRAEDGRRVERVDIRPFIGDLPGGRTTHAFSSDDASGSTSQAASIVESIEAGAKGLLLDEDTCATNFMMRDVRMQALVSRANEPITPFVDRVRGLYENHGVSTVLVMGGCGDYFDVADTVIRMHAFRPEDATDDAKQIAAEFSNDLRESVAPPDVQQRSARIPLRRSFDAARGRRDVKIDVRGLDTIDYGETRLELRGVEQLIDESQTRAIAHALHVCAKRIVDDVRTLPETLDALEAVFDQEGLDALDPFHRKDEHPGRYARPRRFEIAAAINRLRTLCIRAIPD